MITNRHKWPFIVLLIGLYTFTIIPHTRLTTASAKQHSAAFVLPLVTLDGKEYLWVGREAGGNDKGTFCIPGGSSRNGLYRAQDPLETASREFCEETLTNKSPAFMYSYIKDHAHTVITSSFNNKTIITYKVRFSADIIKDIITHFHTRRKNTRFWQYYYREMNRVGLIEWKKLKRLVKKKETLARHCTIEGLVYDHHNACYRKERITLRPILVKILQGSYKK